jgi:uncharacterized membrane protein
MKNRNVGYLISGIAIIIGILVFFFNLGMKNIVSQSCVHGPSCPMYDTITFQTYVSLSIAGLILLIGLFFIITKENEKVIIKHKTKTIKEKPKKIDFSKLDEKEKELVKILEKENGAVFQAGLMEKMNIGKVGITRLLDKLEAKQIIERKRRGMNNVIILK